jgi:transposase
MRGKSTIYSVRATFGVSHDTVYQALYESLRYSAQERVGTPWPHAIGIDEHGWRRREFVTMIVNQSKRHLIEVVKGKSRLDLETQLAHIPGRENVGVVSMDMCEAFRNFSASFFPQAKRVADKFHVLRLLSGAILKKRRSITGTNADRKARGYLLMNSKKLDYFERLAIRRYLMKHPELQELYHWKEALHGFYQIRGQRRAQVALHHMLERMQSSQLPEIKRLRKTLLNWREEILNYFQFRITNARVEGFNCKASLVRRRAYGYRSHLHYRLRLLSACT